MTTQFGQPADQGGAVTGQTDEQAIEEILALEEERCRAITESDWAALGELLSEDFTYGFLSARIEDKVTYLAGIPNRRHGLRRSGLKVRIYGDAAVMTGEFAAIDADTGEVMNAGTGLQVYIRSGDGGDRGWKLVALSTTRFGPRSTKFSPPADTAATS